MQMSGEAGDGNPSTNLIIHYGSANILDQTVKFVHILGAIQESGDLASLFQWSEFLKNIIQFPSRLCA